MRERKRNNSLAYETFFEKIKNRQKKNKQERKQNLRQGVSQKIIISSEESNDEEYAKKTLKEGNKWWDKINKKYFKKLSSQFLDNMKQFTTSEDIMELGDRYSHLLPYFQSILFTQQPSILNDNSIRIIYRRQYRVNGIQTYLLAGYELQQGEKEERLGKLQSNQRILSFHIPTMIEYKVSNVEAVKTMSKYIDLKLLGTCTNSSFVEKCLTYENIWRNEGVDEVDKQIQCWENQLIEQHAYNIKQWQIIQDKIQEEKVIFPQLDGVSQSITKIRRFLMRNETFTYFRAGYSDKTYQELQKALQYYARQEQIIEQNLEKKKVSVFDTDCKICFSTRNDGNNSVIYCDDCNTSFHQSCYGVQHVPESQFYCDTCTFVKEEFQKKDLKVQKPFCQICYKGKFPIKKINNHFYHVACLILFNFADIKNFEIQMKPTFTYEKIVETVIQNQLQHGYCEFCPRVSNIGMQLKCMDPLCYKSFHPICAYLDGCFFDIKRTQQKLVVQVFCQQHKKRETDLITQIFMRRFFCNYKSTVKVSEEEFETKYKEEEAKRIKTREKQANLTMTKRILRKTKMVKYCIQKSYEENLKHLKNPQKKESQTSKTVNRSEINTETAELLKPYKNISKQN